MKKYYYLFIYTFIIVISFLLFDLSILNKNNNHTSNNIENSKMNKNFNVNDQSANTDTCTNNTSYKSIQCTNKVHITIHEFINNMQCSQYTVKDGETLTDISNNYSSTCTINASLKLIKTANNINSSDLIQSGMTIKIPEIILKNGTLYKVKKGDTWSKICDKYYPVYDLNYIIPLLIYINDFKDNTLPLDAKIFLPKI